MRFFLTALRAGCLLAATSAFATGETPVPLPPLTDAQLAEGLSKFAILLEKDIPADARWVGLTNNGALAGLLTINGDGIDLKGNGFLVREKKGVEAEIWLPAMAGALVVKAKSATGGQETGDFNPMAGMRQMPGEWKDADLAHDVDAVTDLLRRQMSHAQKAVASRAQEDDNQPQMPGYLSSNDPRSVLRVYRQSALLWAVALQRTGHSPEAVKIGSLALKDTTAADREALLNQGFNFVASAHWRHTLAGIEIHQDWKLLRDDLDNLIHTFPIGWQQRDAARALLHQITERATQPAEPPLKLGTPLSEASQQELLGWLKSQTSRNRPTWRMPWTLLAPLLPDENIDPSQPASGPPSFPASKGVSAIPMLAALLTDNTMMPAAGGLENPGFTYYGGGTKDAVQELKQLYQQFPKPVTRADVAWTMLQQIIPQQMNNGGDESMADRAATVMQWYGTIKDSSSAEIALSYLENGDSRPNIVANVITLQDEKKLARAEEALISTAQIYNVESIEAYVRQRGPKAVPFIKKLRAKLEGDLARFNEGDNPQKKQFERTMSRLESLAKGEMKSRSADELLAALAKMTYGDTGSGEAASPDEQAEANDAWKDLPAALSKLSDLDRLKVTLKHLPDFKMPQMAGQFYAMLLDPQASRGNGPPLSLKLNPEQRKQAFAETKELWLRLLETKFPNQEGEGNQNNFVWFTALAIECLVTGRSFSELGSDAGNVAPLGARLPEMIRTRAAAFLGGQEPVPWPDPKTVPEAEVTKLRNELGTLPPDELRKRLDILAPAQFLALHQSLAAGGEWPEGFTKLSRQVQHVNLMEIKDAAPWQSWKGRTTDFDSILALAKQAGALDDPNAFEISLRSSDSLDGWTLQVRCLKKGIRSGFGSQLTNISMNLRSENDVLAKHGRRACVAWFSQGARQNTQWMWLDAPTATPPADNQEKQETSKMPEILQQLTRNEPLAWTNIKEFFSSSVKPSGGGCAFYFLSASSKALDEEASKRSKDPFAPP